MKMRNVFFILFIVVLTLTACGSSDEMEKTDGGTEETDDKSETDINNISEKIVFAANTDVQTLDPHAANDKTSSQVIDMIYNRLVKYDDDGNIIGDLASDWEVADDGLTWTFELKEGIKFQDGVEFNAEAVKKSFDRLTDMDNGLAHSSNYQFIKNIEVIDDYIVAFETKEPSGLFEDLMADLSTFIISPKAIEEHGNDLGKSVESTVGTGRYKIIEWETDEYLVLERNEEFFGEKGVTKIIEYKVIPEDATRVMALEAGEVDVIDKVPAQDLGRLEEVDGIEIVKVSSTGQRMFRFNMTDEYLSNIKVRQAILHAIDRGTIIDRVVPGMGEVPTSALTPVMPDYIDQGAIPYDIEKAKELLKEAGYPDGFKTKITTTSRYIQGVELAEVIGDQLKQIGIDAEINVMEWGDITDEWGGLTAEEFDQGIFILGTGGENSDRHLRPIYQTADNNARNHGYYSNEEFDELVTDALTELDGEKRRELYQRAQEIIYYEDPAAIYLYDQYTMVAQRDNVHDVTVSPYLMATFEKAYKED